MIHLKNWKLHAVALVIIVISELIGLIRFNVGPGTVILLPMLYALLIGLALTPKGLKVMNAKDMDDASGLITVTLMLLMARYGTLVGPTLPKIIQSSPALILQEFGNLGTIFIGVPLAIWLGLKRWDSTKPLSLYVEASLASHDRTYLLRRILERFQTGG